MFTLTLLSTLVALLVISVILVRVDIREHRLPNRWTGSALAVAVVGTSLDAFQQLSWSRLRMGWLCALVAFMLFLAMSVLSRGGLGAGDVKLVPSLGLLTGYLDPLYAGRAAVLMGAAAGLASLWLLLTRRATLKSHVAFGPFMLLGFWGAVMSALLTTN